jgi:hypothetical protein
MDAKLGKENSFKPTIVNESLHQVNYDNGVRIVQFAIQKTPVFKNTMFPHRNIQKYTCISTDGKTCNQIGRILIHRRWHTSKLGVQFFRGADCDTGHYLVAAKVGNRLAVSKQAARRLDVEKFNLRKLDELEVRKQYQIEITNSSAGFENIKTSAKKGLGFTN